MSELLKFTASAVHYLKGQLEKEQRLGFRVSVKKTGCSGYSYVPTLVRDVNPEDLHWETTEALKVYVDRAAIDYLRGLTVDYIEEKKEGALKQKKLVFINPNEKSRCGCGESFHV